MTEINLGELFKLDPELNLNFEPGRIILGEHRMLLLHVGAVSSLRKELIDTLGMERARGLLTRMGYASGKRDAQLARRLLPNASDEDLLSLGPKLHEAEGIVIATPLNLNINIREGKYS
ncbi:MAG: XylR N-terminal domain-containing protein, partial [Pseudomonadales bacterium]